MDRTAQLKSQQRRKQITQHAKEHAAVDMSALPPGKNAEYDSSRARTEASRGCGTGTPAY
jgi:hypothetical protein